MGVIKKAIKPMFKRNKWNILRGDTVKILAGKDKGQVGTVTKVIRDTRVPRVLVEGLNLNKRHIKRQGETPGGIVTVESPIHYSNVALVDPVTKAAVRATRRYLEDGTKVRVSRGKLASQSVIPRPEILKQRRKPHPLAGSKDTPPEVAGEVTYVPGDQPTFGLPRQFSSFTGSLLHSSQSPGSALLRSRQQLFGVQGSLPMRMFGFAASPLL